jgi:hypothetical protein
VPSEDTQFKPGVSGNPAGRPRLDPITTALRQALESTESDGRTKADRLAAVLLDMALAGDPRAIREVLDRTEGKPAQQVINKLSHLSDEELLAQTVIAFRFEDS